MQSFVFQLLNYQTPSKEKIPHLVFYQQIVAQYGLWIHYGQKFYVFDSENANHHILR